MKRLEKFIELTGGRPLAVDPSALERAFGDRKPYAVRDGIAIINISGPLMKQPTIIDEWFDGATAYGWIAAEVGDAATDENVRAILLHINSPGGEVAGSFETMGDIAAAGQLKPVWAVADDLAASAAYLLASAASTLYLPGITGEVGSIGIIARHFDYSGMLKRAGVDVTTVFAGKRKNDFSPYEPLSKDARQRLESEIDRLYTAFVEAVADNRGLKTSAVRATEAGLFTGKEAIDKGLADRLGTPRDALQALKDSLESTAASAAGTKRGKEGRMPDIEPKADATTEQAPDIEKVKADALEQGFQAATEIMELCALAGAPEKAAGFIIARKSSDAVRKALLEEKASKSEEEAVSSKITPGDGAGDDEEAGVKAAEASMKAYIARKGGR